MALKRINGHWIGGGAALEVITEDAANSYVGIAQATPMVALDVVHDYDSATFEAQLSDNEGGGDVLRYGTGTLTAGKLYFLQTDASWVLADADAVTTGGEQLLGFALGTDPATDGMLLRGFCKVASGNITGTPVIGAPVYLSTTGGGVTFTAPTATGDIVRSVGRCVDVDTGDILLLLSVSPEHVELA